MFRTGTFHKELSGHWISFGLTTNANVSAKADEVYLEVELQNRVGLLDFGSGSEKMIEIPTDGYQHAVAATNGLAFAYFRQIAAWCASRHDPDAAQFTQWADQS
jgi:hypothetical protein